MIVLSSWQHHFGALLVAICPTFEYAIYPNVQLRDRIDAHVSCTNHTSIAHIPIDDMQHDMHVGHSQLTGGESAPKGRLNTMLQQTHGAAALYAMTAAGLMELLPLPSEEPRSAAELTGGGGCDAKVLQQLLHLLATCEILEELED